MHLLFVLKDMISLVVYALAIWIGDTNICDTDARKVLVSCQGWESSSPYLPVIDRSNESENNVKQDVSIDKSIHTIHRYEYIVPKFVYILTVIFTSLLLSRVLMKRWIPSDGSETSRLS
jgi:hypothetical protein